MTTRFLRPFLSLLAGGLLIGALPTARAAQPVGMFRIPLEGSADTLLSIPLERRALFAGQAESLSVDNALSLSGASGLDDLAAETNGAYFYLAVRSGALEGYEIPILAIDSSTVSLGLGSEPLEELSAGDAVAICPYWTPGSLFAHSEVADHTQLYVFGAGSADSNESPDEILTYLEGEGWFTSGDFAATDYPLRRGDGLLLRLAEGTEDSYLNIVGRAPLNPTRKSFPVDAQTAGTDTVFGLTTPVPVSLGDANLGFADRTSLFFYEEDDRGYDPGPSQMLTYYAGYGWFDGLFRQVDESAIELKPGRAYVLRTPGSSDQAEWLWSVRPSYLK